MVELYDYFPIVLRVTTGLVIWAFASTLVFAGYLMLRDIFEEYKKGE